MILCFTCCVFCSVLGIDIGEKDTKVSLLTPKGVLHYALTFHGKKPSPTVFSFWNQTRASNYTSTQNWDNKSIGEFNWAFGAVALEQCFRFPRTCVFRKIFNQDKYFNIRGYEITALTLYSIIKSVKQEEAIEDGIQVALSIPPGMKAIEKSLLYIASLMAGANTIQFVDTTTAPAYFYALERSSRFLNDSKNIAFVDIGATGIRVSIFNFDGRTRPFTYSQLSVSYDNTIGSNNVDTLLAEKVAKIHMINISDLKTKINFLDDISKVKEMLSIHPSVDLKFEDDFCDDMKVITVTRDELESVSAGLHQSIKKTCEEALAMANLTTVDIVELVGGGSRSKFIPSILTSAFGVDSVSRTMDAEAAIALGTGYSAADLSPQFIVSPVNRSQMITSPSFVFFNQKFYRIFKEGSFEDHCQTIQLSIRPNQSVSLFTGNPAQEYIRFKIGNITSETKVELSFIHNYFLMPVPDTARCIESGKNLTIETLSVGWELSPEQIKISKERVQQLIQVTENREQSQRTANEYEAYILKIKAIMSDLSFLRTFASESDIDKWTAIISDEFIWFDSIRKEIPAKKYEDRLKYLHSEFEELIEKTNNSLEKPKLINKFQKLIEKSHSLVDRIKNIHEEDNQFKKITCDIENIVEWFRNVSHTYDQNDYGIINNKYVELYELYRSLKTMSSEEL